MKTARRDLNVLVFSLFKTKVQKTLFFRGSWVTSKPKLKN